MLGVQERGRGFLLLLAGYLRQLLLFLIRVIRAGSCGVALLSLKGCGGASCCGCSPDRVIRRPIVVGVDAGVTTGVVGEGFEGGDLPPRAGDLIPQGGAFA